MSEQASVAAMLANSTRQQPARSSAIGSPGWKRAIARRLHLEVLDAAANRPTPKSSERRKTYISETPPATRWPICAACWAATRTRPAHLRREHGARLPPLPLPHAGEQLVGPNLADVGLAPQASELLESIVEPNAKIAEGFQDHRAATRHRQNTSPASSAPKMTPMRCWSTPTARKSSSTPPTIEERFEGLSAMPEDLVRQMTPRDLRDLVEYLSSLCTPADRDRRPRHSEKQLSAVPECRRG